MAKFNFKDQELKDLAGVSFRKVEKTDNGEVETPVTVADAIQANLLAENQEATSSERYQCFQLAERLKRAEGEVEFSAEEIVLIKKITGRNPNPLIIGRIWDALEGK